MWKITNICQVLKSGSPLNICNYRPIAIICNFGKLFEIILDDVIYNSLKNIVSSNQHGFMAKQRTVTNLLSIKQFTSCDLDSKSQVDVINTDFQKAFEEIDQYLLLSKLRAVGFSDALLQLIKSYLIKMVRYVEYSGDRSLEYVENSGVPKGSNVGPMLFPIFINDLSSKVESMQSLSFADDVKVYSDIGNILISTGFFDSYK